MAKSGKNSKAEPTRAQIRLRLNGEPAEAAFAPHKTLLEVLREDLSLPGTKHGCELGECGTCAVLVDGKPVLSCLLLGLECEGRERRDGRRDGGAAGAAPAAEGVRGARRGAVRLLHARFPPGREGAPRFEPEADPPQIREALAGNICRCTGYIKIFEAVELAAAWMRGEDAAPKKESLYGFDFDESGLLPVHGR